MRDVFLPGRYCLLARPIRNGDPDVLPRALEAKKARLFGGKLQHQLCHLTIVVVIISANGRKNDAEVRRLGCSCGKNNLRSFCCPTLHSPTPMSEQTANVRLIIYQDKELAWVRHDGMPPLVKLEGNNEKLLLAGCCLMTNDSLLL